MRSRRGARILLTVIETLVVPVLAGLAWWCWQRGVIITVHRGVAMNRIEGRWWATATAVATLAGILLLDGGRRVVVARSTRPLGVADPVSTSAEPA